MLLPSLNLSMVEVSRREGVSEMSLSNWRKQLSSQGSAVSENKPLAENWSAETKFAVVLEAAGLSEIDLGEYCRRKGLYPEQINSSIEAVVSAPGGTQHRRRMRPKRPIRCGRGTPRICRRRYAGSITTST